MAFLDERLPRPRRRSLQYGLAGAALALCLGSCSAPDAPVTPTAAPLAVSTAPPAKPAHPNVLFILADTLRADRITMQRDDRPLMPNLAKLAGESRHYANCRAQAAWTKPSMATLFTSLYPGVHRVLFGIDRHLEAVQTPQSDILPDAYETMAEYLKAHGFATAGVQSNTHVTEYFGFSQGFDSYVVKRHPEFHGADITNAAFEELDKLKPPFFLYAHYMDVHGPYDLPKDHPGRPTPPADLTESDRQLLDNWNDGYLDLVFFQVGLAPTRQFGDFSPAGQAYVKMKYDLSARYLDSELGRLVERVSSRHPNTIIVLAADHGEELFEHGSVGHAKTVFEEVIHVPLLIKVPGEAPQVIDAPVGLVDVLPTLAGLLGLPPRAEWQGRDASSTDSLPPTDRPIFGQAEITITGSNRHLEMAVVGARKLIVDTKKDSRTVFDLEQDPGELAGFPPGNIPDDAHLAQVLEQQISMELNSPQRQQTPATTELTDEQRERIKMIGYLQE